MWNPFIDVRPDNEESEEAPVEEDSCEGPVSLDCQIWTFPRVRLWHLIVKYGWVFIVNVEFQFKEEHPEYHDNIQDMDILDMNILDDTENGIPAEDEDDLQNYNSDVEALLNEDGGDFEPQDESGDPEARKQTVYLSANAPF